MTINLATLTAQLTSPDMKERVSALHILELVDEVRAVDVLRDRIRQEEDERVRQVVERVGRYLYKLRQDGYDTIRAMCEHFNVYSDVLSHAGEEELKRIRKISEEVADKRKDDNFNDQMLTSASMLIAARTLGPTAVMGAMAPGTDMSSNLGSVADAMEKQAKRLPAIRPGTDDISHWVQRLQQEQDPRTREQIIAQFGSMNNPAVLPVLARVVHHDTDEKVKAAAKKFGRLIYWHTLYWEMAQDGSIDRIMKDFANELGITIKIKTATQEMPIIAQNQSVADMLKKAEERRKRRGH